MTNDAKCSDEPFVRACQFCGCWTNAKQRACCEAGRYEDSRSPAEQVPESARLGANDKQHSTPARSGGPSAVLEELKRNFKLGSISLDHTPLQVFVEVIAPFVSEFDRLRAENEHLSNVLRDYRGAYTMQKERAERAEADNAALLQRAADAESDAVRLHKDKCDLIDKLRGGVVVPEELLKGAIASCGCSVRERESGHRSECFVPELSYLLAAAKKEQRNG